MRKHGVKFTQQDFLDSAFEKWGNLYDYSKVVYKHALQKVCIVCPEHGEFYKTPAKHVNTGQGCPVCSKLVQYKKKSQRVLDRKFRDLVQPEDHKIIPLTKGHFAKVDNDDFDTVKDINWKYHKGYAMNTRFGSMHRFIINPPPDVIVDHENNNRADNRKENLRLATDTTNAHNSKPYGTSSQYKGVSWSKTNNKWHGQLVVNGVKVLSRYFNDEIECALTFDLYALKYQGEFAWLNFPENREKYEKELGLLK